MKDRNIFAYTAPGGPYPEYVSINRVDGEIYISVRSPDGGPTAKMRLPADRLDEMIYALRGARPTNLRAGSVVSTATKIEWQCAHCKEWVPASYTAHSHALIEPIRENGCVGEPEIYIYERKPTDETRSVQ